MDWNPERLTEAQAAGSLVGLLAAIRTEHEERWQVNAEYYRAAMRDIALIRVTILALFILKCAEWFVSGD